MTDLYPTSVRQHYKDGSVDLFAYPPHMTIGDLIKLGVAVEVRFSNGQLVIYRRRPCQIISFRQS